MDVFSHWLWGMALTRKKVSWKVGGTMGVLPDLLAFIPASIYRMMNGIPRTSVDDSTVTSDMPVAWEIYQWTHSLTFVAILYCCAYYILKSKAMKTKIYGIGFRFFIVFIYYWISQAHYTFSHSFLHPFSDLMFDGLGGTHGGFGCHSWGSSLRLVAHTKAEKAQSMGDIATQRLAGFYLGSI